VVSYALGLVATMCAAAVFGELCLVGGGRVQQGSPSPKPWPLSYMTWVHIKLLH
jgi:hypothetical protein